jgi:hypothetical protein
VQHRYTLRLTRIKKANALDIHEIHFFQIQSYSWSTTFDLTVDLINAQIETPRSAGYAFCPYQKSVQSSASSTSGSEAHSPECNDEAIHNSLKGCDLKVWTILNFQEFLSGKENTCNERVPTVESACLRCFEPVFVDPQALDL